MSYTDLVMLLPDWAWLLLAGGCVLTALFAFLWMLPSLVQTDPYDPPEFAPDPADWADWSWEDVA